MTLCSALAGAALLTALAGCQVKQGHGDLVAGKQQFVAKCGSCHALGRAKTTGTTGPNLDAAFQQSVKDGFKRSTIRGVVQQQILYPARRSVMSQLAEQGKLPRDRRTADDIAAYVASAVGKSGQDSGSLGRAVATVARIPNAMVKGGTLEIDAFPTGDLKFVPIAATAKPGMVMIKSLNKSSVPHNIAVKGPGANEMGAVVSGGGTSQVSVNLNPGSYQFLCTVPGHEQAGMKGPLTVK
jgi:uncharacterized cupredoxin-like copper-binding protein